MLDEPRILAKLDELHGYLQELRTIRPRTFEDYTSSALIKRACERLLHIAIEATLDIAALLIKGLRLGLPSAEPALIEKLAKAKVLEPELAERLQSMRRFRNVLVHRYNELDDRKVYAVLRGSLEDFERFMSQVRRFLARSDS